MVKSKKEIEQDQVVAQILKNHATARAKFNKEFIEQHKEAKIIKERLAALKAKKALEKNSKSKLKQDIGDTIKMVESVKIPKSMKPSKNISKAIEITEMIAKTPKLSKAAKEKHYKEIDDIHKELDKLSKASKKDLKKLVKADKEHIKYHPSEQDKKELKMDMKVMQQAKGYKHKSKDVTPLVQHYVNEFKSILSSGKAKGVITRALNKLRDNFYYTAKPSEVDDANALIIAYRETLPKVEKPKKAKATKATQPSSSYAGDKKYKSLTVYIKKHKPHISDSEDIDIIVKELIDKNIPRMSVKKLDEVLEDLGYGLSGSGLRHMRGRGAAPEPHDEPDSDSSGEENEGSEEEEHTYQEEADEALDELEHAITEADEQHIGHGNIQLVIDTIHQNLEPNNHIVADIYKREILPHYRSSLSIDDSLDVIRALYSLGRDRNVAIQMLADYLRERRALGGKQDKLKRHRDDHDHNDDRGVRLRTGTGMKRRMKGGSGYYIH